jgi:hypothetical protein|uniref:hypothetical protein n=1 Tax=Clostridium butyricum TaxID=1492 RepID=UPI001558A6F6|nr:hypothetical protein [Clostridium butyricum]
MKKAVNVGAEYYESKRAAAQAICDKLGRPNQGYGFEKQLQKNKAEIEGFKIIYHN